MKKILRMILFSALALYFTSLWNKGFNLNLEPKYFIQAVLIITVLYYLVVPISKLILLPLNLLTLGLISLLVYFIAFYFIVSRFSFINISASWVFPGITFGKFVISKTSIGYLVNVFISALSISTIINLLEALL